MGSLRLFGKVLFIGIFALMQGPQTSEYHAQQGCRQDRRLRFCQKERDKKNEKCYFCGDAALYDASNLEIRGIYK